MSSIFRPTVAEIQEQQARKSQNITENQNPVATEPETSDINTVTTHEESPKVQENKVAEMKNQDPEETAPEQPIEIPSIRLSEEEQAKLEKLEDKIKKSVVEGWKALAEIQYYENGKLWKSSHSSFEDYVESRFDFNRKHSMRLVAAGRFLMDLDKSKTKSPRPIRESHIREITQKLPESHRVAFWDKFCDGNSINARTVSNIKARELKEAVVEYRKDIPVDQLPPKVAREKKKRVPFVDKIRTKSIALLDRVNDLVEEHPDRDAIQVKLDELIALIKG